MTTESPYEGLTEDEFTALAESSTLKPGEDASQWAVRAKEEAAQAQKVAADRRAAAAEPVETPEATE